MYEISKNGKSVFSQSMIPFDSIGQALAYYNHSSPVRAKSVNLIEIDKGEPTFKGFAHQDLHAALGCAINAAIKDESFAARYIFYRCAIVRELRPAEFLIDSDYGEADDRLHIVEAASNLGVSSRVAKSIKKRVLESLESEFIRFELIERNIN